jgi:phosphoribosyl-AMP cyclohydrolase / phosphoribosyl-ATP pyrophosphohydrolase
MILDSPEQLSAVHFDERGLVPVVTQHATTGEVLMLAFANREALERTLQSRAMWYFSRSRGQLWHKGESSGNTQALVELALDCDSDAVLARVLPAGPACHTGARNCFGTAPTLRRLADIIEAPARRVGSYTTRLLDDPNLRWKKLGEEALELALACQAGPEERVTEEAADLLYHVLVATIAAGVSAEDVLGKLEQRLLLGRAAGNQQSKDQE